MSALAQEPIRMSESEYLEFERQSEIRHEYINGEIVAMAGASDEHNLIVASLTIAIGIQLRGGGCKIYANEMRVKVENSQSYYYPDIMVLCGEKKFADYRQMPSVQEYALVYQDKARIEHYYKNKEGKWEVEDIVGLDKYLKLASIDCSLDLTELYKKLKFALKKDNP